MRNSEIQRRRDQLAGASGGGQQGIAAILSEQRQAAGGGHFDGRQPSRRNVTERCNHRIAARPGDGRGARLAAQGIDEHIGQPVATIGHRHASDVGRRTGPRHAARHRFRRLGGGQATFKSVGREYNFHGYLVEADIDWG